MDYSKTINLPKTNFPMRANLPNKEPNILKKWNDEKIYNKILESRENKDLYILHDGPPYANGHIHIGHALNKILKDVILKHKTMSGFKTPYVPGWDCHGLPIELNVTKKLGNKARTMPKVEIRQKCREYADEFVDIQKDEFKRLGVFADYEHPYKTLTHDYESTIVDVFGEILEKGYIYRSKKPIYWCPNCVTALAEAEVEYDNHTSTAIYVKFKVDPKSVGNIDGVDKDNLFVVIWTTTPWTLPANLAVCLHPRFEYGIYQFNDEFYILAKDLADNMNSVVGTEYSNSFPIDKTFVDKLKVNHPFIERESKVIYGEHVTLEQGTGIVHTAPGHGHDDYIVGLQNDLEVYCPVDDYGRFTNDYPEMEGIKVFDANEKVLDILRDKNALISSNDIEHSYPHCWRCKKPLIFRATEQWFLEIDHDNLREKGLESVDKTKWVPSWGEARFKSMAESRPDWCLSRQRTWGVPIPSFRCKKCEKNLMTAKTVKFFAEIAKNKSIDAWFSDEIEDLIPAGTVCSCGSHDFVKEFDILDVWFDSGVSHFAVLEKREDLRWPADLYLEGSDQHRGWFQSSLWPSLAIKGEPPYKTVLTHGFVLDESGKAMSKSQGNVVPPEKLIKQFGADILRLWVISEDYKNDLRIGMDMVKQIADSYRRIRNTFKFIIGNISDFSKDDIVAYEKLPDIDKWILHKLYILSEQVLEHYEKFEFHNVYRKILNFCAVELSSIYFDVSKDILYVEKADSEIRRANQTVLYEIYNSLVRLIAPVLSFTAEEIWQFENDRDSIHLEYYYNLDESYNNIEIEKSVNIIVDVKKDILKALEILRKDKKIKSSLETEIKIFLKDESYKEILQSRTVDELKRFFQIAKFEIVEKEDDNFSEFDNSFIAVNKTTGEKCIRCWNFSSEIGADSNHPELCPRCAKIVNEI